jgi:P4 family phage/plasmid primase-like protien
MKDNNINNELTALGLAPLPQVDMCPERSAYRAHLAHADYGDKDWVKKLNGLKMQYLDVFHHYVAIRYPHLLFEEGEDKVYWLYDDTRGVYVELSYGTVRGMVVKLMEDEELRDKVSETAVKNFLIKFRGIYHNRGHAYDDFDAYDNHFHSSNGWVNLTTLEFTPHTPDRLSRIASAVAYDADAVCPTYDTFLDKDILVKKDAVRVIDQYSGLMLTGDIQYQKMLTIIGRPGSGKSTLIDVWTHVLGNMATSKKLTELAGDSFRFAGGDLAGRTLCWFDEVEVKRSEMSNSLGTLITGKHIRIERKGINGVVNAPNKLKCVLTANNLPTSSESGMYRRLILIYFKRSFYDEGITDPQMERKMEDESSGILNRMIRGLQDLRKMGGFTMIEGHEDSIEEYKASSDSIAEFLDTYFEFDLEAEPIETSQLFKAFKITMEDRYISGLTPQRFGRLLSAQPLNAFSRIETFRTTHSRYWRGLKVRKEYEWKGDTLVEKYVIDF